MPKTQTHLERLETRDLFKSACLLGLGADLKTLRPDKNGFSFVIDGVNLFTLEESFENGKSLIEPKALKSKLDYLRGLIRSARSQSFGGEVSDV